MMRLKSALATSYRSVCRTVLIAALGHNSQLRSMSFTPKTTKLALLTILLLGCKSYPPSQPMQHGIFSACCGEVGTCVPTSAVSSTDAALLAQDQCDDALVCAPTGLVESASYVFPSCRAFGQNEGRCLPTCLPDIAKDADRLDRATCDETSVCVPCFDPLTGESTGACTRDGDAPTEAASLFGECCEGRGRCIPSGAIEDDLEARLATDSCEANSDRLCVPDLWIDAQSQVPTLCHGYGGAEGRCLLNCVGAVSSQAQRLLKDVCQGTDLCVPCFDPITGEDTQACSSTGDPGPTEPTVTFPTCCGTQGSCVPIGALTDAERSSLSADTCAQDSSVMCVPSAWISDPDTPAANCRAFGEIEGRCLPACLPDVIARSSSLHQDGCADEQLCVPCYDPVNGESTAACNIGNDPGPTEQPKRFDKCCGDQGSCVPTQAIDEADRMQLAADSCGNASQRMCVPDSWLSAGAPPGCTAPGDLEGRCMPSCLPSVAARAAQLVQADCAAAQRCVPCFDPLTGESTQACEVGSDMPTQEPRTFPTCGAGAGRCVPNSLVSQEDAARLSSTGCSPAEGTLCVPSAWLEANFTTPPTCRAPGNLEGRCLADFLPEVESNKSNLRQMTCGSHELCVPCFDPLSGNSTEACTIRGDTPREQVKLFSNCCSGEGTCVPGALLSSAAGLATDSCLEADTYCVPSAAAHGQDPGYPSCLDANLQPGACMASCFINPWLTLILGQGDCIQAGTKCVTCGTLNLGTGACL